MKSTKRKRILAVVAALAFYLLTLHPPMQAQSGEHWVGTWTTSDVGRPQTPPTPTPPAAAAAPVAAPVPGQPPISPSAPVPAVPAPFMHFNNQTLRQIVHTSIGGNRSARGTEQQRSERRRSPSARLTSRCAIKEAAIVPQSDRALTFSGRPTITIPPGAMVYSDPVDLNVPPMGDVAIDLYLPGDTNTPSPLTMHNGAFQTNYVSETGNHAGEAMLPVVAKIQSWFLLSRVEVMAPEAVGAVVTFGDSITDGTRSTPDTNSRWPDHLARRLTAQAGDSKMGVLNAGIAGNRVLIEGAFDARRQCVGAVRVRRFVAARRDAHHRDGRHQRHRQRAPESDADRRGPHRRLQAADRSRPHAGDEDLRRDADAV